MPWIRTTDCPDISTPEENNFCICQDGGIDLTPGTVGQTQAFECAPCGGYGVQPAESYCCNFSGSIS